MKQIPCRQAPKKKPANPFPRASNNEEYTCLLYTSDAADEL